MKAADGKWVNRRLDWDGQIWPAMDGKPYYMASTQNLHRVLSGRVLAPVTLWGSKTRAEDAPESVSGWWAAEKHNAVVYTDDLGETWHLSSTCQAPGFSWVQWEPTVWEQPDGSVMMFARNNTNWSLGHGRPTSGQYAGPELGPEHHRWLHNQFAEELGRPKLDAAREPTCLPIIWMDPTDEAGFDRDFVVPGAEPRGGSEVVTIDGRQILRLRDHGSVGVDVDENDRKRGDRVFLRFRFRIEEGDGQTLCTVGDFNQAARLIARHGQAFLSTAQTETPCGRVHADRWTSVSVETYRDVTRARVGGGSIVEVHHKPEATWIYLGEGFPKYNDFPGTRFLIDVDSVETRVESKSP